MTLIRPNLEKLDKEKYLKYDIGVFSTNVKYNTLTRNIIDKEKRAYHYKNEIHSIIY